MGAVNFTTVKSRIIRLTRLDACGVPVIGLKSTLVTKGFVKIESKWDIEDGDTFEQQNAWGEYCVQEKDDPKIKGGDTTTEFCSVNPDAYDIVTGARVIAATATEDFATLGDSIGYAIGRDTVPGRFALESWSKVAGATCGASGDPLWVYSVWANQGAGKPGDQTLEKGTTTFPLSARAEYASAEWGNGPYASPVTTLNEGEVFAQVLTDVQPPAETDGAVALA